MKWIKEIVKVQHYTITCLWSDNEIRKLDLKEFIFSKSKENSYHQLKDKARFSQVKCDGTTLYWENGITIKDYDGTEKPGPLDIDPDYLYKISQVESMLSH
ncbi:MAG: DUF2442 domain-containing protein [Bacteroidota bacterium]|nr:DUF2442 domain-containing protein [Bacteroidota bacterium]